MGHVVVNAELAWKRKVRVPMLVDTGATYTVIPASLAKKLGIARSPWRLRVRLADGRRRSMYAGAVRVRLEGREAGATVLLVPDGAESLLGVEALEALGLAVDPKSGKLRKTRAHGALLYGARTGCTSVPVTSSGSALTR